MRCMACDAEMILMNVVQDDTMPVPGFEWRTFMCSACHDVERHFAFVRPGQESDAEPVPIPAVSSNGGGSEHEPREPSERSEASELQEPSELREANELNEPSELREASEASELQEPSELREANELNEPSELREFSEASELQEPSELRELRELSEASLSADTAPSIAPASVIDDERELAPGLFRRLAKKMRW
jgi:hypothetical protein